ncbi:MAG TPA: NAD(P)/FAD-dependent oxidoreductase, partial [Candidatus Sulfotelmatobacter sp.]|nr:NAD(P)/FAD-dependent oxidoreductase [Candidatus Sulfotelmatobacter sp.]
AQAHWHGFRYRIGALGGLDRAGRTIEILPSLSADGVVVIPAQRVRYDTLVIAIGSLTNDFGTPGVSEHALRLDTVDEAARCHRRLIDACLRAQAQTEPLRPAQLKVAIIGAGATGVELAAELHKSTRDLVAFGLDRIEPDRDIHIHLIEAAPRILPALPERIAAAATTLLQGLGVQVHVGAKVAEVLPAGVRFGDGRTIDAELVVWAAGVKASDVLKDLGGLETNRINQLVVRDTLETTRDDAVFALGDCAACPWLGRAGTVPPRAQAAHQQASHMVRQIRRRLAGRPLEPFRYRDFGSLVSLGEYTTVGNLMGRLIGRSFWVEGLFARLMYVSLYKLHELALHGFAKVALDTLARLITRRTEPVVKLH